MFAGSGLKPATPKMEARYAAIKRYTSDLFFPRLGLHVPTQDGCLSVGTRTLATPNMASRSCRSPSVMSKTEVTYPERSGLFLLQEPWLLSQPGVVAIDLCLCLV